MDKSIQETISKVVIETFEKLAFVFVIPEENMDDIEYDNLEIAKVSFIGPFSGDLFIGISKHILPDLAKNMLGLEDDDIVELERQRDMLKEILNIICGNLLPEIYNPQYIFHIGTPEILNPDYKFNNFDSHKKLTDVNFLLDEGLCNIKLIANFNS